MNDSNEIRDSTLDAKSPELPSLTAKAEDEERSMVLSLSNIAKARAS